MAVNNVKTDVRLLKASEIECRVGTLKQDGSGCSLLLYKDARVDMRLLDEIYGRLGWKRDHELINGNLFCTISVWDESKKEWVSKQDVGTESYTEKEKGQASDAFKRAGFNWGIGRELYTGPFIWIPLSNNETYVNNSKRCLNTKFRVKDIGYNNENEIDKLVIVDDNGKVRFSFGDVKEKVEKPVRHVAQQTQGVYTGAQLQAALNEMAQTKSYNEIGVVWNKYPALHNVDEFKNLTIEQGKKYK